jgi:hypothetical protein
MTDELHGTSDSRERETTTALYDLAADLGQKALVVLTADRIFEEIPIFKTLLATSKIIGSIGDILLTQKIEKFLRSQMAISAQARRDMVERLEKDPAFGQRVGEHLIELLDRVDSFRKPAMLGAVFAAFATKKIELKMLRRLNSAITIMPESEINVVRQLGMERYQLATIVREGRKDIEPDSLLALTYAGLMWAESGYGGMVYQVNQIGVTFVELDLDRVQSN